MEWFAHMQIDPFGHIHALSLVSRPHPLARWDLDTRLCTQGGQIWRSYTRDLRVVFIDGVTSRLFGNWFCWSKLTVVSKETRV